MKTQPFAIKSVPAGDCYWVVVPDKDLDGVELSLDIGGGEGPIIASAEWIPSSTMKDGGFLCWMVNGSLLTETPRWMPKSVQTAISEMAVTVQAFRRREGRENA